MTNFNVLATVVYIVVFGAVLIYVILLLGRIARGVEKISGQCEAFIKSVEQRST